ncbi:MAG TPA: hypothetical protein VFE58_17275 [Tepidisphaeraceae bacterium]|jgi:putative transposase|nr:hypothetical protein [Tepidisphaeraceae bacterium]
MVLRPKRDHDLARYLSWITNTHVKRYRAHYPQTSGHLYQGRYKSFPVQTDSHFLTLLRYVESNPIRCAKSLSPSAQSWSHSSLGGLPTSSPNSSPHLPSPARDTGSPLSIPL